MSTVLICSECRTEACAAGELMCDGAFGAATFVLLDTVTGEERPA